MKKKKQFKHLKKLSRIPDFEKFRMVYNYVYDTLKDSCIRYYDEKGREIIDAKILKLIKE